MWHQALARRLRGMPRHHAPYETGKLPRPCGRRDVGRLPPLLQPGHLLPEPQPASVRIRYDLRELPLLPQLEPPGLLPVYVRPLYALRALCEQPPQVAVPGFRYAGVPLGAPRRALPDREAHEVREVPRPREPAEIAGLGDYGDRAQRVDAAEAHQLLHLFLHLRVLCDFLQPAVDGGEAVFKLPDGNHVLVERLLQVLVRELKPLQPFLVGLRPVAVPVVDLALPEQERQQLLPGFFQPLLQALPHPAVFLYRLSVAVLDMDLAVIVREQILRQQLRVDPVVLDLASRGPLQ